MRRFGYGVLALTAAGLIVINLVRLAGGLSTPPDRASLAAGACQEPCWHGVRPNLHTLSQAEAIIRTDRALHISTHSEDSLCWQMQSETFLQGCAYTFKNLGADNSRIAIINLMPQANAFRLGDAVNIFGLPVAAQPSCNGINGNVYFPGNIIAVTPVGLSEFSPDMLVEYVSYVTTATSWYDRLTPRWRGFRAYKSVNGAC